MPTGDRFGFGVSNVFVFVSRQGLLFLLLLFVTFATGTNYANNLILGLFFYLLSLGLVCAVLTFLQLSSLRIELQKTALGQAGGLIWVELAITSHSKTPSRQVRLSFYEDNVTPPEGLSDSDKTRFLRERAVVLSSVKEAVSVCLPVIADKRGQVVLPKLRLSSTYPLGVVKAWAYGRFVSHAYAYPTPKMPPSVAMGVNASSGAGQATQSGQSDFDKLDSYQAGESLARVSWGHLARGAGMLTKQFADGVATSSVLDYADMPASDHEGKLSQLCYLVKNTKPPFALHLPSHKGQAGFDDAFIQQCLLYLAKEP